MWRWIKIPKAVALLAFLLPWMSVSCSKNTVVSATGFGLTFGKFTSNLPNDALSNGNWNLWLVIALAAIVAGLVVAFLRRSKIGAALSLATTGAALAFLGLGMSRYTKTALLEQGSRTPGVAGSEMGQAAAAMIHVNWHYGLWLAVAALILAGIMAALVFSGRDVDVGGLRR